MSPRRLGLFALLVAVFLATPVHAQPTDLFFSEYIEGSSNNKALEIFNGTASPINLTAGGSTYTFNVTVNGDMTAEANQTFFVNVTSVVGANVTDGQGTGTIVNDDVAITPIHDIQGPGNSSPIVGATVTTRGVVTGVKTNGFFIQEPDGTVDADPATSEGVFVFTSSAPPADAVVGNFVQVTATVAEFVPTQDHDPLVVFFQVAEFANDAEVSITKVDSPDPVAAGGLLTYALEVTNNGPEDATDLEVNDELPAGTTFSSVAPSAIWTCTTPAAGATGTVTCTAPLLGAGETATIDIVVTVDAGLAAGTVLTNTATLTTTSNDANPDDNEATTETTVSAPGVVADYSLTKTAAPDPVFAGDNLTYMLTVTSSGPGTIANVSLTDFLPAGTTFQSLTEPAGWDCSTPAVGMSGTVTCTLPTLGVTSEAFTLVVQVGASVPAGSTVDNVALLTSDTPDANPEDTQAATSTTVLSPALLTGTKTVSGTFTPNSTVTYTVVLTNTSKYAQSDNPGDEFTDLLPPELLLVSASATSGTAVANVGTNTVTWNGAITGGGSVTITIQATLLPGQASGTIVSNQGAFMYDADGEGTNEASGLTDDPSVSGQGADPTTFAVVLSPAAVSGTKTAGGPLTPGSTVTYTVILSNAGPGIQNDNAGDEFTDILPPQLALVSATATSGTAVANVGTNTVTWNGAIAANASVTITIQATLLSAVAPGTTVSNQGTIRYDADGDGTNEATGVTDDPGAAGSGNPTTFTVAAAPVTEIPTLGEWGLILMTMLLALAGAWRLRGGVSPHHPRPLLSRPLPPTLTGRGGENSRKGPQGHQGHQGRIRHRPWCPSCPFSPLPVREGGRGRERGRG